MGKEDSLFVHCEPVDKMVPISTIPQNDLISENLSIPFFSSGIEEPKVTHFEQIDPFCISPPIITKLFLPILLDGKWKERLIIITKQFLRIMRTPTSFETKCQFNIQFLEPPILCNSNQVID